MLAVASPIAPSAASPAHHHHHIHHAPLPRTPYNLDFNAMLPSPPGSNPFFAPLSPPAGDSGLDLEPSPSYSPLSSPSHSPRPPPSPPLGVYHDQTAEYRERLREQRLRDQQAREKALQQVRELAPALIPQQQQQQQQQQHAQTHPTHSTPPTPAAAYQTTSTARSVSTAASVVTAPATPATPTASIVPAVSSTPTTQENIMQSSDSIALRSTLRLLTLQRERAKRDISELESLREAALKEPLQFVEYIQASKRRNPATGRPATADLRNNIFTDREIPKAQEVYRCPPIEWTKYQILGAPLDSMHNEQRKRPSPSRPAVPHSMQTGGIIGFPTGDYADGLDSGLMQGHLRLFDGIGCVGR